MEPIRKGCFVQVALGGGGDQRRRSDVVDVSQRSFPPWTNRRRIKYASH